MFSVAFHPANKHTFLILLRFLLITSIIIYFKKEKKKTARMLWRKWSQTSSPCENGTFPENPPAIIKRSLIFCNPSFVYFHSSGTFFKWSFQGSLFFHFERFKNNVSSVLEVLQIKCWNCFLIRVKIFLLLFFPLQILTDWAF